MVCRTCSVLTVGLLCVFSVMACAPRRAPDSSPIQPDAAPSSAFFVDQVERYVDVQVALAADDYEQAQVALTTLATIADAATAPLVRSASSAEDIETLRARFKPLSEYLAAQDLPEGYARAYCPMYDGGSNWVQADGPVRNPYYGSAMLTCGVVDSAPGAHMDHGPQHGGTVFMAPDSFHHIEGTYPEGGIFRLYATDNYREPVDVRSWSGRAVLEEAYDPATDEFTEVVAFELLPSPDAGHLEAVVGDVPFPAEITAKVQFGIDGEMFPEERFDFIFVEYSAEGDRASPDTEGGPAGESPLPLSARIQPDIPELTTDLVAAISARVAELEELITAGRFTEIFVPALQGKELALALEARQDVNDLSARARSELRIGVRHVVRAAYLLDWYGDLGNKQQVSGAFDVYSEAVQQIVRAYGDAP